MAKTKIDQNVLFKVGLVAAAYFVVVKPLFEYLGFKESKDDKEAEENIQNFKGWDPNYYLDTSKKGTKTTYIRSADAEKLAKDIQDSWGTFNDSEEQIYGVLRLLKNQVQLSQVAHKYWLLFKVDLARELKARLSDAEFYEVVKIVTKLPKV